MLQPRIAEKQKQLYYEKGYWRKETLLDHWQNAVRRWPEREYLTDGDRRVTYREMDGKASRLAGFLRGRGVGEGDVVACQIPVWLEFAVLLVACLKIGAVLHPLSLSCESEDLLYFLDQSRPKVFVCPTFFRKRSYEDQIGSLIPQVRFLREVLLIDRKRPKHSGFLTMEEAIGNTDPLRDHRPAVTADDVAVVLCTSGSTGLPKGAMLTHNNIWYAEQEFVRELHLTEDDVMFMPSPLNHATGLQHGLVTAFLIGSRVVLQEMFQVEEAVFLMNREKCTYSMGATTFIYDILQVLQQTNGRIPSMKFYLCGGAPIPQQMVQKAWSFGIRLCEVYGSTESTPHLFVPPEMALEKNGSVSGRPIKGVEVRVVDEQGNDVPRGVEGEEYSRGPNVFVGYIGCTETTSPDENGWNHSGDLCVEKEEGFYRITGRKKEIIIRGGENLNIHQLEENLELCPQFSAAAIVPMPDSRMGERICAYAVLKEDVETFTLMDLLTVYYQEKVPKWQWPERLEIVSEIPRTESGKIKRYVLQQDICEKIERETRI